MSNMGWCAYAELEEEAILERCKNHKIKFNINDKDVDCEQSPCYKDCPLQGYE